MTQRIDIYGGVKPWEVAAYTLPVAAQHVRVPTATLRSWVIGRDYHAAGEARRFLPLIKPPPTTKRRFLSFINLVEAHVLASMRRKYFLPLHKIRSAITYLEREFNKKHPLATEEFRTDGVDLFIEKMNKLVSVSRDGQVAIRETLTEGLTRITYENNLALQLYPFVRDDDEAEQPRFIVIDPRVAFGRAVLVGTSVPAEEIAERFRAGESADALAEDFRVKREMVEEAVRATRAAA